MSRRYDVVVVGAGHAGCEAAHAAARLGASTLLLTLGAVARLSCNPAMGGLAKGCLVREIDALGGLMARATDACTLQFRRLNTRKGLAVQASRAQVDVDLYPSAMRALLAEVPGLDLRVGEVVDLRTRGGRVDAVVLGDGTEVATRAVVLTTGTFLGAVMHCGEERVSGGRVGDPAAGALARVLAGLGLRLGRLKTGTTPRVDAGTVDWSRFERQDQDPHGRFGFGPPVPRPGQIDCWLGATTEEVHAQIRSALPRSPLHTGAIAGRGPRYCPSIEDKVVRFPDRSSHPVFLEPEGLGTPRVYVNGLSTSLPRDVQDRMVAAVPGLERAHILQYGYAVEYETADPTDLGPDLQHRAVPGLYLAGQVNGTSGYEEAAAQGIVAGISAARGEPFVLGRDEAYIGVLVDDLVTRGVGGEPYRMFPSRAEHRLLLREDNADRRLTPRGRAVGLVDDAQMARFEAKLEAVRGAEAALAGCRLDAGAASGVLGMEVAGGRGPWEAAALLRRPEVEAEHLRPYVPGWAEAEAEVLEQVEVNAKYAGYIAQSEARRERSRALDQAPLGDLDFTGLAALSSEVRERLAQARPSTLGAASRLPGVTPAAVEAIAMHLIRSGRVARPGYGGRDGVAS